MKKNALATDAAFPASTPNPNTPEMTVMIRKVIAIERNISTSK
jgi:hypothetical protein